MSLRGIYSEWVFIKKMRVREADKDKIKNNAFGIFRKINELELDGIEGSIVLDPVDDFAEVELLFKRSNVALVEVMDSSRLQGRAELVLRIIIFATPLKRVYENLCIRLGEKLQRARLDPADFMLEINGEFFLVQLCGNAIKDGVLLDEGQRAKRDLERFQKMREKILERGEKVEGWLDEKIVELKNTLTSLENEEGLDGLAFSLASDRGLLCVERVNISKDELIFKATKLMPQKERQMQGLRLVRLKDPLEFKDGSVSASVGALLDSNELASKYLEVWDKYWEQEGELLLQRARKLGEVRIAGVRDFTLSVDGGQDLDLREHLSENDYICVREDTPEYLQDKTLGFLDYLKEHIKLDKLGDERKIVGVQNYKIDELSSREIKLEPMDDQNVDWLRGMNFSLSIYGNIVSLKRQYKARQRMLEGKSANPILPMIFSSELGEEAKEILREQGKNVLPALSDEIRQKIFPSNPPTSNQEEAIRMAINTPDIAIIQGPPGTGKTTVLNAIIERLNELNDKDIGKRGSIFIGAFQHSAVENLLGRMSLNGLPVPKYGSRQNKIDISSVEHIKNWAEQIANKLEIKPDSELIKNFKKLKMSYLQRPSLAKQKELLTNIVSTTAPVLKIHRERAGEMLNELKVKMISEKSRDKEKDLAQIYKLRESQKSFSDDGLLQNRALLNSQIGEMLSESEKQILKKESFSEDLVRLKKKLVERFSQKISFEKEKPNDELLAIIEKVLHALKNLDRESKINTVLAEFKDELLGNPYALQDLIKDYSVAFGATTGQSSKSDILKAKGIVEDSKDYEKYYYDNVIIDEAAMISPLDLFLVLVLARQRIILVGDHRQLPHMINQQLIDDEGFGKDEEELLRKSMFAFLKNRAVELEKIDGTKRFITLNNQYRTHELLGNLVSELYYEKHGEGYASPLGTRGFEHSLKGIENIPALWLDLGDECGREGRDGTSRVRECEAELIVKKLCEWIGSEAGGGFSYGVISFYAAQVRLVQSKIKALISRKDLDETVKEKLEKVKIGSVDSFQGMEFDVVFLSPVRCLVAQGALQSDEEREARSAFGFLAVPNRLCVAMSRQKKLLVVVGSKEYFQSEMAKKYVSGLHEFAKLCESKGRVISLREASA